ncbi:energy-coupling factor ABC transporter ATP-binding protein [Streptomycetaceae bacterium NBC_01309]
MGETTGTEAEAAARARVPAQEHAQQHAQERAQPGGTTGTESGSAVPGVPASLEVEGLAFAYPDGHQALFGVDMRVERGERVALLGPNGAGKTTLVLHLNGILSAATGNGRGTVRVAGLEVAKPNLREIRRRVGIVFQDPDDQLFMPSVREDVAFGPANLGLRGAELDERVAEALGRVGMERYADRPPHHLSFGQRRRVAVATVLAMRPEILVLDEPSSNLDPASRRELAEILDGLDVTVLMVTHDLPYALELCPRALVLSGGVIAADGPTRELLADRELMDAHRLELPYGYARPDCDHCAPRDARPGPWGRPGPGPTCEVEHG